MIKSITLDNYKCYKHSKLSFKDITVIVGSNNAGKSTLIEALRLVAIAVKRFKTATYKDLPTEFGVPKAQKGFRLNTDSLMIDLRYVLYQLEGEYARIDAVFDNKGHVMIYLNPDGAYACIKDSNDNFVTTKVKAAAMGIKNVRIMPQIGLIREDETRLSKETIERGIGTRLSSRHFRNELLLFRDKYYKDFVDLAQKTWEGLRIQELNDAYGDDPIGLLVFDGSYSAEIGAMGSGLQMWLQIIWFLSQCDREDTMILDEPDVYMHPDMQRRVFDLISSSFNQVIVATHSVEIISAVDPHKLVSIDRKTRSFTYANDISGAQSIINNIGGIHNLSLLRLGSSRKCIFVEGYDLKMLNKILKRVIPDKNIDLSVIPTVILGGRQRFNEALGAARLLYNEANGQIVSICILDRDYSTQEQIDDLYKKAQENNLSLHVWQKKEIENYLVIPDIVFAATKLDESYREPFFYELDMIAESLRDEVFDGFAQSYYLQDKTGGVTMANAAARRLMEDQWTTLDNKTSLANGKTLLKLVRDMVDKKFNIRLREEDFIKALNPTNAPRELFDVLELLSS